MPSCPSEIDQAFLEKHKLLLLDSVKIDLNIREPPVLARCTPVRAHGIPTGEWVADRTPDHLNIRR
jgi:hypothetical protein